MVGLLFMAWVGCRGGCWLTLGSDFSIVELATGAAFIPLFLAFCHPVLGQAHCNTTGEFAAASSAVVDNDAIGASIHCRSLGCCVQAVLHAGNGVPALAGGVESGHCIGGAAVKLEENLDTMPC